MRVFLANHGCAGTAGQNDEIVWLEDFDIAFCEGSGLGVKPAVVKRLSAAGLCLGEFDRVARAAKQFYGGNPDFGVQLINQASDVEGKGRHRLL
jgi:hypothetical protein